MTPKRGVTFTLPSWAPRHRTDQPIIGTVTRTVGDTVYYRVGPWGRSATMRRDLFTRYAKETP